ncbi:anthranilate synthase component 1 [Pseudaeromonas sp. ZJS20]|uniref:anthranilate synthase component 1 n=1 Tax=Pseudaeromonas aegiceratis TaxID=3153928 RepID=UPI00390C7E80
MNRLVRQLEVRQAAHVADPLALFSHLTQPFDNSLLLESAEIDSKAGTQSLLLIDACVRLTCYGNRVQAQAANANGQAVLAFLAQALPAEVHCQQQDGRLEMAFPAIDANQDEDSRLKAMSVLDSLRLLLAQDEALFLGGLFAYDLIANYEQLPQVSLSDNDCPDFCFYLAETLIHIDHLQGRTDLHALVFGDAAEAARLTTRLDRLKTECDHFQAPALPQAPQLTGGLTVDRSDKQYCADVERLKGHIRKGDIFQVVPSRCFSLPCPAPLLAYRQLKRTNPSPYMFYMNDEAFTLFGASPESSVKFDHANRQVEMYPIAGTRRRGLNPDGSINLDLDGRLELDLRQDAKETAEHLMLVDLARNDIARISEPGTRHVKDLLNVDRYSHVMHLVSRVVGTLRADLDALHAYQACMNMGTLTGAPKIRASELIREVEGKRRGSYGGAVGYLNGQGDMDTCIVIRSAFVKDGRAYVQAGAGVVFDSKPQAEADETRNKAAAVLNAIALTHGQTLKSLLESLEANHG